MSANRASYVIAALGLSGCATIGDPPPTGLLLTANSDNHAEFYALSTVSKGTETEVRGWAKSKNAFVAGTVHIEALLQGKVTAAFDVAWSAPSLSRLRRHRKSFHFSASFPREVPADSIRISHGHREHLQTSREEAAQ